MEQHQLSHRTEKSIWTWPPILEYPLHQKYEMLLLVTLFDLDVLVQQLAQLAGRKEEMSQRCYLGASFWGL